MTNLRNKLAGAALAAFSSLTATPAQAVCTTCAPDMPANQQGQSQSQSQGQSQTATGGQGGVGQGGHAHSTAHQDTQVGVATSTSVGVDTKIGDIAANGGGASIAGSAGSANVNFEGTRIPRFTAHLGLGNAVVPAGGLPGIDECQSADWEGTNFAGLFASGKGKVVNDETCVEARRQAGTAARAGALAHDAAKTAVATPGGTYVGLAAFGKLYGDSFGQGLNDQKAYAQGCLSKGQQPSKDVADMINGQCAPKAAEVVIMAPAPVAKIETSAIQEPKKAAVAKSFRGAAKKKQPQPPVCTPLEKPAGKAGQGLTPS